MTTDELYQIAEKNKIEIDEFKMREISAVSFPTNCIAIDPAKFETTSEFKTALAHEIGHCQTGSFYNTNTPEVVKLQYEYDANKRAIELLLPKDKLRNAMKQGATETWQLAEIFGVTEQLIRLACWIYFDKCINIADGVGRHPSAQERNDDTYSIA